MRSAPPKTNAARALDRAGIAYELRGYPSDPDDLSAARLSAQLALDPDCIFKTIVCLGDGSGALFAVLPVTRELDLKALARAAGHKRVEPAPLRRVRELTGYERGAVTALAARKTLPVYLDDSALRWPRIGVSGGAFGCELLLAPHDYLCATAGVAAAIAPP